MSEIKCQNKLDTISPFIFRIIVALICSVLRSAPCCVGNECASLRLKGPITLCDPDSLVSPQSDQVNQNIKHKCKITDLLERKSENCSRKKF